MKIEKLFRAWDESQKYMAYQGSPDIETLQSFMHHFGDNELMIYTGQNDINQKKLFEDDILLVESNIFVKEGKFRICFFDGYFVAVNVLFKDLENANKWNIDFLVKHGKAKLIGNIHQNPELL